MEWIALSLPFLIFTCAVRPIAKACATQDALWGEFPGVNWICLRPAAMQLQESSPVVTRIAVMCLLDRREIICKLLPITRLGRPERKFEHSLQLPWPLLHHGFQRDALAIYNDAIPHLRKDFPLRITGHSLGGAVAMILAAYFENQGYTVERLVTFGQPKFAAEQPSETILSVTTRVVNDLDVVPMVPPHTVARQYQHFAIEVILREGQDYVFLNEHDADRLSIGDFWRNITHFSTKDHHIDSYLANIQGKIENGSRQVPYLFKDNSKSSAVAALN